MLKCSSKTEILKIKQNFRSHLTTIVCVGLIQVFPMGILCVRIILYAFFLFWRYTVISTNNKDLPINEEVRVPEVRLIGTQGEQLGVMKTEDARNYAYNNGVDLVLIAPTATPPVCRAIDYGKFCFERDKREKEAKKKQVIVKVKEVQLSCRIEMHDFTTRVNQAKKFLAEGNKVKAVVRFRGREMAHMELGREVILKFEEALEGIGQAEKKPVLEGRYMSIIVSPVKADKKK